MMNELEFTRRVQSAERRLYRTCATLLKSDADCADAVQEALLKAWRGVRSLKQDAYFETWLTRIAINECKQLMRKNRPACALDQCLPAPPPPNRELRAALMALDEKLRLPVCLHYVNGFDLCETARILRLPVGTVKSRLHRARNQLRKSLLEEGAL